MAGSPTFIARPSDSEEAYLSEVLGDGSRFFAAEKNGRAVAHLKIGGRGETFVCATPGMENICGAYCLPEFRGTGIAAALLGYTAACLGREGRTRLGVDFESINPAASGFWHKHFTAYTHSVVRRIDEHALTKPASARESR